MLINPIKAHLSQQQEPRESKHFIYVSDQYPIQKVSHQHRMK